MKEMLCERRIGAAIIALALAVLLLLHPSSARVGNIASAQSGSGERTPKTTPKTTTTKTASPKKTVAQPKRTTAKRPPPAAPRTTPRQTATPSTQAPPIFAGPVQAQSFSENLNGATLEMVLIPAGTFTMGSPDSEASRSNDEGPQHRVTLPQFYMGKYEVTQAQYQAVMGTNPAIFKGDNRPVENVSWNDATEFCRKLSQMTGKEYRLPTEAEWEYACRAGTTTPFAFGSSLSSEQANFNGNYPYGGAAKGVYRQQTTVVGSFQPNGFGLYDMHGNVWEWCVDYWHENYNGAPVDGSGWWSGGNSNRRVMRGGSWNYYGYVCRSAYRTISAPDFGSNYGLRVVAIARK